MTANIELRNGELVVSGILDFVTVITLWNQSLPLFRNERNIQINLEKVTESNGAALALLIEWKRFAALHQKSITYQNVPETLLSIAKISGIVDFLKNS